MTSWNQAKFENFFIPPIVQEHNLKVGFPTDRSGEYAISIFINFIQQIGAKFGLQLSYGQVLTNILGFSYNSGSGPAAVNALNAQLLPLIGVVQAARMSLGLPNTQ